MAKKKIRPKLVFADCKGNIYDHPDLLMLARKGKELVLPRPDELIPLPEGSDLYLLPRRAALGFDAGSGQIEREMDSFAVAAFVSPGYTLSATAAYLQLDDAPILPLFSYGAVGFAENRFWVCAKQVDTDRRQIFTNIPPEKIEKGARNLLQKYPENRLLRHLGTCALTFCCPAAKNLALGRFEAPLPTSKACNARCVGCISLQEKDSGFPSPQNRIDFTPTADEIVEVMQIHASRAGEKAIYSFGQGCEGEPLLQADLIAAATARFRMEGGKGTVNINTNGSLPQTIALLAMAGISSIRVSLNSFREKFYNLYYRPINYSFADVASSISEAKANGIFVSLNYLVFPGVNDTEAELEALLQFLEEYRPDFIQMRNLSLDPKIAIELFAEDVPCMGLENFLKRIKKSQPSIGIGYFNPFVENGG